MHNERVEEQVEGRTTGAVVAMVLLAWASVVSIASVTGAYVGKTPYLLGGLINLGIAVPTIAYFVLPELRAWVESIGLWRITAFHAWRIAATPLFLWYGVHGLLPEAFVAKAAWGDLVAAVAAGLVAVFWARRAGYLVAHVVGTLDFVTAIGTGMAMTLASPVQMSHMTDWPAVLIPMFAVGVTASTHLMAFDMLRRGVGERVAAAVPAKAWEAQEVGV